jgi:hypothetical protein
MSRAQHVSFRSEFDPSLANSRWAENMTRSIIAQSGDLIGVPYGASRVMGDLEHSEHSDFIASTKSHGKRPDILVFRRAKYLSLRRDRTLTLDDGRPMIDCLEELADSAIPAEIVRAAHLAIEVEFSSWRADCLADYGRAYARGPMGMNRARRETWRGVYVPTNAKVPRLFLKVGDIDMLREWQQFSGVPLAFAQFFYDSAFLFSFDVLEKAYRERAFRAASHSYGEGDKDIWKVPYSFGVPFAQFDQRPEPGTVGVWTRNGQFKAIQTIEGGRLSLTAQAHEMLVRDHGSGRLTRRAVAALTTSTISPAMRFRAACAPNRRRQIKRSQTASRRYALALH